MKFNKKVKKFSNNLYKTIGKKNTKYVALIVIALFVGIGLSNMDISFQNVFNALPGSTTTIYLYETETITVTEPLPDGTWFKLKVQYTWSSWVDPADRRDMNLLFSDLSFTGKGDITISRLDDGVWFTINDFLVMEGASIYISLNALRDPGDTFHYETEDYNLATAGFMSGYISFYDSSAPMGSGAAGYIMFSWVQV